MTKAREFTFAVRITVGERKIPSVAARTMAAGLIGTSDVLDTFALAQKIHDLPDWAVFRLTLITDVVVDGDYFHITIREMMEEDDPP